MSTCPWPHNVLHSTGPSLTKSIVRYEILSLFVAILIFVAEYYSCNVGMRGLPDSHVSLKPAG